MERHDQSYEFERKLSGKKDWSEEMRQAARLQCMATEEIQIINYFTWFKDGPKPPEKEVVIVIT